MKRAIAATLGERRAEATRLLMDGISREKLLARLKEQYGIGLGMPWINAEIRRLKSLPGRYPYRIKSAVPALAPAAELPPDPRILISFVTSHTPFSFDGHKIKLLN